jgi:hypothetical protein
LPLRRPALPLVALLIAPLALSVGPAGAAPAGIDQNGLVGCGAVMAIQTGSVISATRLAEAGAKDLVPFGAKALARSRTPGAKQAARALAAATIPSKLAAANAWCAVHPVTTHAQPFAPQTFTGTGNTRIRISTRAPAIVHIVTANPAPQFFSVEAQDARGQRTDLLANTRTAYDGFRPINLLQTAVTTRLVVDASGEWRIDVSPLSSAPTGTQGHGDQVLLLSGTPTSMTIDGNDTGGFFAVDAYGSHTMELVADSLDPVHTSVRLSPLANRVLVVRADGDWRAQPT